MNAYIANPHIQWGQGECVLQGKTSSPGSEAVPYAVEQASSPAPSLTPSASLRAGEDACSTAEDTASDAESPRNGGLGAGAGASIPFPMDALPPRVKRMAEEICRLNGFKPEYFVTALICAAATAVGNSRWLRVKGDWIVAPSIFAVLVGAPGTGKTPPLKAAFAPIRKWDQMVLDAFLADWERHKANPEQHPKPVLHETILDDFTLESLARAHSINTRAVTIINDEISMLFTSAQRYNAAPLVNQLLSAWSGSPLKYNRVSLDVPLVIPHPCVGLMGTTQTAMFEKFITSGNCRDNGFLDRMLIAYPAEQELEDWDMHSLVDEERLAEVNKELNEGLFRLMDLDRQYDEPGVMTWSPEALDLFVSNHNEANERLRGLDLDELDTRLMKIDNHVARLALVLEHIERAWPSDESVVPDRTVSVSALRGAISLMRYYENCYERVMARIDRAEEGKDSGDSLAAFPERRKQMLMMLNQTFTTDEAMAAGQMLRVTPRTVARELVAMMNSGLIVKTGRGRYMMVAPETEDAK